MNVYVESNFVLELALLQEQHPSCDAIVELAAADRIHLVIPAYSLVEHYETLTRFFRKRQAITEAVRDELRQLGRSAPYEAQTAALEELTILFTRSQEEERTRLRSTLARLVTVAELIPLTSAIIADSLSHQDEGFSPQDAVVYSSVLRHLKGGDGGEHMFLNRNSKDFDAPDVQDRLEAMNCRILFQFDAGLRYIRHRLGDADA